MSADASPPQGYETKAMPGYVPATVPASDHPGPGFAGQDGYSNSPGVAEPAANEKSTADPESSTEADTGGKKSKATPKP